MKIKSFDELFSSIEEALNSPLQVNWIKTNDDWIGTFNTEKNEYNIIITNEMYDVWKFKYYLKKNNKLSTNLTNFNYDVYKVLSTIYKSIYDFIGEIHPNGLIFGAENDSPTRVKMYSNFCKKCSDKYGYIKYETSFGEGEINPTLYVLYKKLLPEELFDIIKKVTDEELNLN